MFGRTQHHRRRFRQHQRSNQSDDESSVSSSSDSSSSNRSDAESNNKRHAAAKTRSMSTKKKTIINLSSFSSESSSESEEEDSELVTTTKMLQELNDEKLRKVQHFIRSLDSTTTKTKISSSHPKDKKTYSIPKTIQQSITPAALLSEGLNYVGFNDTRQALSRKDLNKRRFIAFFGAPPEALAPLFKDIRDMFPEEPPTCRDLLLTCNWLKGYDLMHVLEGRWGNCEDYMRPKIYRCQQMMQALQKEKMKFVDSNAVVVANVDTVSFTVQEFRCNPSAAYYDSKSNSAGVVSTFYQ